MRLDWPFRKGFESLRKGTESHNGTGNKKQQGGPIELHTQPLPAALQKCTRFTDLATEQKVLWEEASEYLHLFCREQECVEYYPSRLTEIQTAILQTGTYWQSEDELVYAAKIAWRNSTRCIGRLHWKNLHVRDLRNLSTAEEIFDALLEHVNLATNGGKIRPMISIFAPAHPGSSGPRICNPQLIRYAGYQRPDGTVIGDPAQVELTKAIRSLGWPGGPGTAFDLLPIVIQTPGQDPKYFPLPPEMVLEVPLSHPHYPWFSELDLKWHALPAVSNMRMECGGITYTAAPFNGWYMETEIGARNLGDTGRYNLLPVIGERMGLNTRSDRTLWKDRALIELNVAVISSFAKHGVTLVDHHTASRQFVRHYHNEQLAGRRTPADWGWIVPPISGSSSPVFHMPLQDWTLVPNFFAQENPWPHPQQEATACPFADESQGSRQGSPNGTRAACEVSPVSL